MWVPNENKLGRPTGKEEMTWNWGDRKKTNQIRLASCEDAIGIYPQRNERPSNCIKHVCRLFCARREGRLTRIFENPITDKKKKRGFPRFNGLNSYLYLDIIWSNILFTNSLSGGSKNCARIHHTYCRWHLPLLSLCQPTFYLLGNLTYTNWSHQCTDFIRKEETRVGGINNLHE